MKTSKSAWCVGAVLWISACGGATTPLPAQPVEPASRTSLPLTTVQEIQSLHYPTVLRCDVARIRSVFPAAAAFAHRMGAGRCEGTVADALNGITIAVDVRGSYVAAGLLDDPAAMACLGEVSGDLNADADHATFDGGAIVWTRTKPPSASLRERMQRFLHESPSQESLCELHLGDELVRHVSEQEHITEPVAGSEDMFGRAAWDFHFMQSWDGSWQMSGGTADALFDTQAHAHIAGETLRVILAFVSQQISQFAAMGAAQAPQIAAIGEIVVGILAHVEIVEHLQTLHVDVPATIASLTEIARLGTELITAETARTNRALAQTDLESLAARVSAWSLAHPRVARRATPFPIAERSPGSMVGLPNDGGNGLFAPSWMPYAAVMSGRDNSYELTANGNEVTLHAYYDSDGDSVFAHLRKTGVRNPADSTITWSEVVATDELE